MPFLAIDIGNTRLKWALYAAPQPGAALIDHGAVFLEAIDDLAETDWQKLPAPSSMLGCIVAGEGIRRRAEAQLEIWDVEPRWVVSLGQRRRRDQRLRPSQPARRRPLGRDDRRPPAAARPRHAAAGTGGDGRHRGDGRRARRRRPLPRRPDPAGLRPDAARARDGHRRPQGTDRRDGRLPHQHQRRAHERRLRRDRRRGRADAPQAARAIPARSRC